MSLRDRVDNIGAAHDAYELAIAHNGDTFNSAFGEQSGDLAHRRLFRDNDQLAAHNISHAQSLAIDFADNIALGYNANNLTMGINDGSAADALA